MRAKPSSAYATRTSLTKPSPLPINSLATRSRFATAISTRAGRCKSSIGRLSVPLRIVLVPLFALCLTLLYLGSGRGYLEHLVVALYSHCFMLVALLATFLLIGLQSIAGLPTWIAVLAALAASLDLGVLVPGYLLLMQKRV